MTWNRSKVEAANAIIPRHPFASIRNKHALAVPLSSLSGEPVGTIAVYFSEPHQPSRPQQALVERYARQAGQVVANARRYAAALDALRTAIPVQDRRADEPF